MPLDDAVVYLEAALHFITLAWYCWTQALHNLLRRAFKALRILFVAMLLIIIANSTSIPLSSSYITPGANLRSAIRAFLYAF